jgi:hypothetical protein
MSAYIFKLLRRLCLVVFAAASVTIHVHSAEPVVHCEPKGGYVFMFINGVWNGPEDAALSMNALARSVVGVGLRNGSPVEFVLAHNPVALWGLGDVSETLKLKAVELGLDWVRVTAWLIAGGGLPVFSMTDSQRDELYQTAAQIEATLLAKAVDQAALDQPDLQAIIAHARSISLNKSLVVMGHSEGALFAGLVYHASMGGATPRPNESIRVIGVGAAASDIPGLLGGEVPRGEPWVTNTSDVVINILRGLYPRTLRGNHFAPPDHPDDFSGHRLIEIYLNPSLVFRDRLKELVDIAFARVRQPVDISACVAHLHVGGTQAGWDVFPLVQLGNLTPMSRAEFSFRGTPGNTCGGERGWPLYSQDLSIPASAKFYGAPLVLAAPYPNGRSPNRRPCSSFVAVDLVPDPAGIRLPKYRVWANATARSQTFTQFGTTDWESQLRFDSGDPWTGDGASCIAGLVPGSGVFAPSWNPACDVELVPQ